MEDQLFIFHFVLDKDKTIRYRCFHQQFSRCSVRIYEHFGEIFMPNEQNEKHNHGPVLINDKKFKYVKGQAIEIRERVNKKKKPSDFESFKIGSGDESIPGNHSTEDILKEIKQED